MRAAISSGATVTAEGFVDQVSDAFAMLRWPKLNFLPVPEDVAVPRAVIEQYDLRPGQKVAGTVRLPVQREKFLSLDKVTKVENQPCEEWKQPTAFDKLTPQFPQGRIILENPNTSSVCAHTVPSLPSITAVGKSRKLAANSSLSVRSSRSCAFCRFRGDFGERDPWQTEGGAVTEDLLRALRRDPERHEVTAVGCRCRRDEHLAKLPPIADDVAFCDLLAMPAAAILLFEHHEISPLIQASIAS